MIKLPFALTRRSIRNKVITPFAITQVVLVALLGVLLVATRAGQRQLIANTESVEKIAQMSNRLMALQKEIEIDLGAFRFDKNPIHIEKIHQNQDSISEIVEDLKPYMSSSIGKEAIANFEKSREGADRIREDLFEAIQGDEQEAIETNYNRWEVKSKYINATLSDLASYSTYYLAEGRLSYRKTLNQFLYLIGGIIIATIILLPFLYIYLDEILTKPISQISKVADKIADGNFSDKLFIQRSDEVGELANNLNQMSAKLQLYYSDLEKKVIERDKALAKKEELEQKKDDFISIASHELKTPVTSIKIFNELLLNKANSTGDKQTALYLSKMNDQINRLTKLIAELLDVSRIQAGKLSLNLDSFSLGELVKETTQDMQTVYPHHKIVVNKIPRMTINGDRDRLQQVVVNFLTNAVKYSPEGSIIDVEGEEKDGQVVVKVRDKGVGISKEHQKKIFDRFYRVLEKNEKTYPGLGMGLYISSEIIKRHKGKIGVTSQPGKGSVFYFSLPV